MTRYCQTMYRRWLFNISSKLTFFVFFGLLSLSLQSSLSSRVMAQAQMGTQEEVSIDQLEQLLLKDHKSKIAKSIQIAYEAVQNERFTKAIQLASRARQDATFADYGYWITASAQQGIAKSQVDKKNYSGAIRSTEQAIDMIQRIEKRYPYSPFVRTSAKDLAQLELILGQAHSALRHSKQASDNFENAFLRLQNQNLLILLEPQDIRVYSENCKKHIGPVCVGWLQKFSALFIKKSEEIKAMSASFPIIAEKAKIARPASKISLPYKAPDLDQIAFEAALKLYVEEKYKDAAKDFKLFLETYPRSAQRYRARYWMAQALSRENETEKADTIFDELIHEIPWTYYGLLAANARGKDIGTTVNAILPNAIDFDIALQPQDMIHLQRSKKFLAEKAPDLAAFELKEIRNKETLSTPFLVYLAMLYQKAKSYRNCFIVIGELIQRDYEGILSSYGLRMVFPLEYLNLIKKYSEINQIDPLLVLSVIKQESAFDEEAGSPVGAMGLMQLMPATAADVDPKVIASNLFKAETSIRIGTQYLKKLMNRFNGNIVLALAGYNAGPTAASRWIKESPSKKEMFEFIESIPYRETREYVSSIIRNYYWYTLQLNGTPMKSLSYFWNLYGPPETPAKLPTGTSPLAVPTSTPTSKSAPNSFPPEN